MRIPKPTTLHEKLDSTAESCKMQDFLMERIRADRVIVYLHKRKHEVIAIAAITSCRTALLVYLVTAIFE